MNNLINSIHYGKTGRNDPCPCGSGKKYKHCCLKKIIAFPGNSDNEHEESVFTDYEQFAENRDAPGPPPTFNEFIGEPNKATDVIKDLQKEIDSMEFSSEEALDDFLQKYKAGLKV